MKKEFYIWGMNNTQTHNTMESQPSYNPLERWDTETLQEEIQEILKLARPTEQTIKNMERMQKELDRRNA